MTVKKLTKKEMKKKVKTFINATLDIHYFELQKLMCGVMKEIFGTMEFDSVFEFRFQNKKFILEVQDNEYKTKYRRIVIHHVEIWQSRTKKNSEGLPVKAIVQKKKTYDLADFFYKYANPKGTMILHKIRFKLI